MTTNSDRKSIPAEKRKKAKFFRKLSAKLKVVMEKLKPGPRTWKGAAIGAAAVAVAFTAFLGSLLGTGLGFIIDLLIGLLIGVIGTALIGAVTVGIVALVRALPRLLTGALVGAIGIFAVFLSRFGLPFKVALPIGAAIVLVEAALVATVVVVVVGGGFKKESTIKKTMTIVVMVLAVCLNIAVIMWLASPGTDSHLVKEDFAAPLGVHRLDAPNPSEQGSYEVRTLFYGSGKDKRRQEFGEAVDLKTDTVDASPFLKGWKGIKAKARKWYWKFEPKNSPLNGRVWFPAGDGPFPLVLVVHGNHQMEEFSDPGYAYLGELLASRGFITVSVDENFLNSSWAGGLKKENSARGWILLQHLKVWQSWNEMEGNPFYRKVDMDNIALIGHSRGGEAVAIAAAFNKLSHYPDNANILFDFNFSIKSVIAIAPSDGQYKPAKQPVPLENINYLVLQGAHDSDVSIFLGIRQYQRLKFTDEQYWFKSALYIYRANHGQFNTVWGRTDISTPGSWLLNLKPLLKGEGQRQIAKIYISAFLEATLHGERDYMPLFRDHRVIAGWLPKTIYESQFEDSSYRVVCNYEEDVDVTTTTVEGGVQQGKNLAVWREQGLDFRKEVSQNNNAVYLGWNSEGKGEQSVNKIASYSIILPDALAQKWQLNPDALLVFSLTDADEVPPISDGENDQEESEKGKKAEEEKEPLDMTVELVAKDGSTTDLPLSQFAPIRPALTAKFTKWHYLEKKRYGKPTEPVLQTYELPLSAFVEVNSRFQPTDLKTIRFRFDRSPTGVIILDEVGFRTGK